jgi:hypothetical protein
MHKCSSSLCMWHTTQCSLGQLNDWTEYAVSIVSNGWENVKCVPVINVLGVSTVRI